VTLLAGCSTGGANFQLDRLQAAYRYGVWSERLRAWGTQCELTAKKTELERVFCAGVVDAQKALDDARREAMATDAAGAALQGRLTELGLKALGGI